VHRLSQQIEAGGQLRGIQVLECRDGGVDGLARDEARRESARLCARADKAEDLRLLAEPEQAGAQHRREILLDGQE